MSKDGINSKDFMIGTLIGGIIGATTALFLTPKSGKELRNNLNEQATSVKEKTERWKNTAVERGTELVAATKEKSTDLVETVSGQSTQLLNKVKDFRSNTVQENEVVEGTDDVVEEVLEEVTEATLEQPESYSKEEVQKKLEETQQAFEQAESKIE